ncbi:hypothetical protein CBR_g50382 [Chara braunii]|uniref:Reverse transcriptase domain-containing protein n=1 Tax=Chara braunii TaxID=69332 RepID=A0A388M6M0_CHABU|nr:hypothetical protein CBR_g50382 [Chara braunii]|eukprot:GBG90201.1 hypothetical protein CBR_g50382 [Chara braunii]
MLKKGDINEIRNWRPISLLNVSYKILAKLLARRLGKYLPLLVQEDQAAFVRGRSIFENIVMAIEALEVVSKEDQDVAVLMLDMEKAYDRVNWSYVVTTLRWMGFGEVFCTWVIALYSYSMASVMVNGHLSEPFTLSCSLRRGCSLAPLLFVVQLEVPLNNIREHAGIHDIQMESATCKVKALADDLFAVSQNTKESLGALRYCLRQYEQLSEAAINWQKSAFFLPKRFAPTVNWGMKRIKEDDTERFLGVQISLQPSGVHQDQIIQQNVMQRTAIWGKAPHLSLFGRALVVNATLFALLWFVGNVHPMGKKTQSVIIIRTTRFLWRPFANEEEGVMAKVAWDLICTPRQEGGLGLVEPGRRIIAMLARWVVRAVCTQENKHWILLGKTILKKE